MKGTLKENLRKRNKKIAAFYLKKLG